MLTFLRKLAQFHGQALDSPVGGNDALRIRYMFRLGG